MSSKYTLGIVSSRVDSENDAGLVLRTAVIDSTAGLRSARLQMRSACTHSEQLVKFDQAKRLRKTFCSDVANWCAPEDVLNDLSRGVVVIPFGEAWHLDQMDAVWENVMDTGN